MLAGMARTEYSYTYLMSWCFGQVDCLTIMFSVHTQFRPTLDFGCSHGRHILSPSLHRKAQSSEPPPHGCARRQACTHSGRTHTHTHTHTHTQGVLGMAWSPHDPSLLLSSAKDNRTICWDVHSTDIMCELPTRTGNWNFDVQVRAGWTCTPVISSVTRMYLI